MHTSKVHLVAALLLSVLLVASGCGSSSDDASTTPTTPPTEEETPTTVPANSGDNSDTDETGGEGEATDDGEQDGEDVAAGIERSELSPAEEVALQNIIDAVGERPDVWTGFSLADLPTVVPLLGAGGEMTSAFIFFHPNPTAAGDAVPLDGINGLPDLHYVPQVVNVPQPPKFSFEFDADVGGVPTYVFPADVDIPEWPAVFVHEGFHVFQIRFWAETSFEDQEKYDLDERNFVLAMLEDAALIDAYQSSGDDSTEALRRFLALRATRLAEFPTTALDLQQESLEGTAEWFEWVHTGRDEVDDPWANPTSGDLSDQMQFARESASAFGGVAPLQRFYHSGATQLALLERLGVDWQPRLEQGAAPSELLTDLVAVDAADFERLVEEARQAYDPSGELAAVAQVWLEAEPSEDLDEAPSFADAPASVIACLAEYGLSAEQIEADPTLLTPEVDQACIAGFQEQVFACIADAGFDIETVDFDNPPAEVAACFE